MSEAGWQCTLLPGNTTCMAINATCYKIITDLGTDPEPSQILICYLCYIFNTLTSLDIDVVIVILTYIESAALCLIEFFFDFEYVCSCLAEEICNIIDPQLN